MAALVYALNPLAGILNAYHAILFPNNVHHVLLLLGMASVPVGCSCSSSDGGSSAGLSPAYSRSCDGHAPGSS